MTDFMHHFRLITMALVLASAARLEAMSSRNKPQQLMWLLQYSIELCRAEGVALESITWPMVKKHINTSTPDIAPLPFDQMFQLMEKNRVAHPVSGDQLVAVMSIRLTGSQYPEAGRYMLWWNGTHFYKTLETEQKASEILRIAGLTLADRGSWPVERVGLFYHPAPSLSQQHMRSAEEQREWLIRRRIEDGHDFGKPKPSREEVIRQLEEEGLIEKKLSRWPLSIGLAMLGALVALFWKWRRGKSSPNNGA